MAKYNEQFKLKVVRECLKDTESGRSVAARHELHHSLVNGWGESYRVHGLAGLRRQSGTYSAASKQSVLRKIRVTATRIPTHACTPVSNAKNVTQGKLPGQCGHGELLRYVEG